MDYDEMRAAEKAADDRMRADLGPKGFKTPQNYDCEHGVYWATCNVCHPLTRSRSLKAPRRAQEGRAQTQKGGRD